MKSDRPPSQGTKKSSKLEQSYNEEQSVERNYEKAGMIKQTKILIMKNFKVILGRPGFVFAHVFTTLLVGGVILLINTLTRYSYENEPSMIYPINTVDNIQKCEFSSKCKSLGYIIIVSHLNLSKKANFKSLGRRNPLDRLYLKSNCRKVRAQIKR